MFKITQKYQLNKPKFFLIGDSIIFANQYQLFKKVKNSVVSIDLHSKIILSDCLKFQAVIFFLNSRDGSIFAINPSFKFVHTIPLGSFHAISLLRIKSPKSLVKKGESHWGIFDLEKEKLLWTKEGIPSHQSVSDGKSIALKMWVPKSQTQSIVAFHDLETGEEQWSLDLFEIPQFKPFDGKINRLIGIHQDRLYLSLKGSSVLEMDTRNGELLRHWEEVDKEWTLSKGTSTSTRLPGAINATLLVNGEHARLVGFASWYYWEIDLDTGKVSFWDLENDFKELSLHCNNTKHMIFRDEHIFFVSDALLYDSDTPFYLAAFNRTTRKIDWRYEFPVGLWLAPQTLQMSGNLLAVADLQDTLHLFERT